MATSEKIQLKGAAQYKKDLQQIVAQSKALSSEMKLVKSSFDKTTSAEEKNEAIGKQLTKQIETQKQYVDKLRQAYEAEVAASGEQSVAALKAKDALNKGQAVLNDMERENRELAEAEEKETQAAERNEGAHTKLNGVMKATVAALAAAAAAAAKFALDSVKTGMEFDKAMSQVAATMSTTVGNIQNLRDYALEMGRTTAFSATQAAEALNYMALAGYSDKESMEMLPNVLNLAAAGNIDLARASDMVTDAQSALNLSMEETTTMVDQMAMASSKTNTSVEQLGEAILTIGATARSVNGGTAELATVLGILADNGIKGSEGGTHLRNAILSLETPSKAGTKALKKLGMSYKDMYDEAGNLRSLPEIFQQMQTAMEGMTQAEKDAIMRDIFNKTDLAAVNALIGTTAERWDEVAAAVEDADGAAEQMADTQLDNLAGDVTLFQSALEGAKIALSDSLTPALRDFVQLGTSGLDEIAKGFQEGGIEGAVDAFSDFINNALKAVIKSLPDFINAGVDILMALVNGIINNLPVIINAAIEIILHLASSLSENLPTLIPAIVEMIMTIVTTLTDPDNIDMLMQAAIALMTGLANGLIAAVPVLVASLPQLMTNIVEALITQSVRMYQAASAMINNLAAGLKAAFTSLITKVGGWVNTNIIQPIKEKGIAGLKTAGANLVTGLWNGINDKLAWIKDKITSWVGKVVDWFKQKFGVHSPSTVFMGIGENLAEGLALGWKDGMSAVRSSMNTLPAVNGNFSADASPYGFGGSVINIYPQQMDNSTIDYIYAKVNARMGAAV
jgi:TP901 family phage tail tape measure protein